QLAGSDEWQSYGIAAGAGDGVDGLYVGANYFRQRGWPFTATLEDTVTDTMLYGEDNVGVFASYRRSGFSADVFVANAQQQTIGTQPIWDPFDTESHDPRVFVDLGYVHQIGEFQSLQLNFTFNHDDFDTPSYLSTPGNIVPFRATSRGYLLEATYRAQLTESMKLTLGGLTDIHEGGDSINAIPAFSEVWYGVYMQLDYEATDWLKLVGGMQGNLPGEIPGGIVPRAGAILSFTDNVTTKLLYGQAFRSPYQLERSIAAVPVIQGNPNLVPETIQTFDVQLAYHTDTYRLAGTWFYSDFNGVVTRAGAFPQTYVNQGNIIYRGVELENDWRISNRLQWIGSMTYQENTRGGVYNTTSAPNWMAKLGLAYTDPKRGLKLGLFDTFYGAQTVPATAAIVNPNPDAYHLLSLNSTLDLNRCLSCRSNASMRLQFLIQNLLDEDIYHVEFERELINTIPAGAGRTFYGGVQIDY
ncbi:MAG: TonB-dependent receptor, partial [Planctomycetales bacterium]|nr:TonB-dependent receptor [Planctomycetales bacterium]